MMTLTCNEVTVSEFTAALEDNRGRVRKCLGSDWQWAENEIMSDLAMRTLKRLDYWHRTNTTSLPAFINQLVPTTVGEWLKTQRPKHRSGMTQAPERQAGRLKPPTDPNDRQAWEEYRRREQTLADSDVICEAADVFESRESLDGGNGLAAVGDTESYRRWSMPDGEGDSTRISAEYQQDMKALEYAVTARWGLEAWRRIVNRCMTSNRAMPLLREIRHWLQAHHERKRIDFDQYPYLTACATRKPAIGPDRRKNR
ncbi:hypothetical protein [Bifidobacterium saguini]|nr:hypothetical protein [Bifidobacterium saguini]